MLTAILGGFSNFFHAIGSGFDWAKARQALNNTPAMQVQALSAEDQRVIDAAAHALATHDLPTLRKLSS